MVLAATQVDLDRKVAIKFLLPAAMKNPEVVARFSREARAAAKIQSEHVARVIDVGVLPTNAPYMVMEYLDGADLAQRIAAGERLALAEASRFVLEACEALAEAHAAGIVHRDLKPANLFLARRPDRTTCVKVLDFGISKSSIGDGGITSTQAVMGSPLYMSPEQLVSAKRVDYRTDIWSLGIVLYEALTGAPPFLAESMPEIVGQILTVPTPSVRAARPDLPLQVDEIVARCLAKEASARFQDVAELARALAPFVRDGARSVERVSRVLGKDAGASLPPANASADGSVTAAAAASRTPSTTATGSAASWGATRPAGVPNRRWVTWGSIGVAGALVAGALATVGVLHGSASQDRAAATGNPPPETPAARIASPVVPPRPAVDPEPTPGTPEGLVHLAETATAEPSAAPPQPIRQSPVSPPAAASPRRRTSVASNAPPAAGSASSSPPPPDRPPAAAPTPANALSMPFK